MTPGATITTTPTPATTLGDLVAAIPAAAPVLDADGLDYCCHGERTLGDACAEAGIDADELLADLVDVADGGGASWTTLSLEELVDHIVDTHHRYLHVELPLLDSLAAKVVVVHGQRHPELAEVWRVFRLLRADLEPHLLKEERVLFPAVKAIVDGRRTFPFGSVENPIRMMTMEHERAGDLLSDIRLVTRDYEVPSDGCASYRSLYERLEALELDTHVHIHKENHTLFPAAIALASDAA